MASNNLIEKHRHKRISNGGLEAKQVGGAGLGKPQKELSFPSYLPHQLAQNHMRL